MREQRYNDAVTSAVEFGDRLYFKGTPYEMAKQFSLACLLLREKIDSCGGQAFDLEQACMPSADGGRGIGGWLEDAVATMVELEKVATEALGNFPRWQVAIWTQCRLPLVEEFDDVLELKYLRPMTKTEALAEVGWEDVGIDAVDYYLEMCDNAVSKVLKDRGYCVA